MERYYVYIFIEGSYQKCALLSFDGSVYKLAYGTKYLLRKDAIAIDPLNLPLYERTFESETIFGSIKDSSPDRWGRYLLEKKFSRKLTEMEYVLANGIDHVGALGFSPEDYNVPMRLTPSGYVQHTFDKISLEMIMDQTEMVLKNEEDEEKLKELLHYGPSLGGARPKYSVHINSAAYLAKYSISQDRRREPLIEFATMKMAQDLKLNVPDIKLSKISNRDVFYIKRFDRNNDDKSPFISALTLCGWDENGYADWSYPVLCQALISIGKNSSQIEDDLIELFRRVAFNIAVNNNDDHPRNHGVYLFQNVWRLSPLYDVVPMDSGSQNFSLAMEIGLNKREASKRNLLSSCGYFKLETARANQLIEEIFQFVTSNWKNYFKEAGLTDKEINTFENAMSVKN
ncbi:MAG: type II toxin-antitoxin system HipA family toxin [Bacteriovoracaceae bacterium]